MAEQIGTKEQDGYEGKVYQGANGKFVAWNLASLFTARGNPIKVTGVTGESVGPKAAAWNLTHVRDESGESHERESYPFLQRVLKNRVQLARGAGGGVDVSVPGAAVQGVGYDEPLELTLKANVASMRDLPLALAMFAGTITSIAARGVYAQYAKAASAADGDEAEEEVPEDLTHIDF
jgi:hypothetical protein